MSQNAQPMAANKPRILVTTSTFPRWPGDTDPPFVYQLCAGLSDRFDIHVLAPHQAGCKTAETLNGIHVHRYRYAPERLEILAYDGGMLQRIRANPFNILILPGFLLAQCFALLRLQHSFRFELVHSHWIIPQGLIAAVCARKFMLTSHGGDLFALRSGILKLLKRWVLRRAKLVTVVSSTMRDECLALGVPAENIRVRSMGVDTKTLFTPPQDRNDEAREGLLYVGRLVEKKGVPVLLRALAILKERGITPKLTIVGDGPDRDSIEQITSGLGLDTDVSFAGALSQDQLPDFYRRASIFILPSIVSSDGDQEGLGLVTIEAMACGCPVVASALPAVMDVVADGVNGLLATPGCAESLAERIEALMADKELRRVLSCVGLTRARSFDWKAICEDYGHFIDEAIGEPQE